MPLVVPDMPLGFLRDVSGAEAPMMEDAMDDHCRYGEAATRFLELW